MNQLQNKLIMLILILFVQTTFGEQILLLQTALFDFKLTVQIGSPPVDQYLDLKIGDDQQSFLDQFIFDSSIEISDVSFYLEYLKRLKLYDMKKSSSADISPQVIKQPSSNTISDKYVEGNIVTDVLQVGNTKFKYTFLSVSKQQYLQNTYSNGETRLNRFQDNIFDLMFSQNVIKTRDYLISLELQSIANDNKQLKKMSIRYDLDQKSDNYKYPSNIMIKGNIFAIKAYGVYLNGEDVTDKLKFHTINFDNLHEYITIPSDLYEMITRDSVVNNILNRMRIDDCKDCKCSEINSLPKIKVVTQEYIFEITPEMYTFQNYNLIGYSNKYPCDVQLQSSSEFQFTQQLLSNLKVPIMYQKEINSLKLIGAQTTTHVNINAIMIVLPLLNGTSLAILFLFAIQFLKKYSSIKYEFYYELKHKTM